MCLTSWCLCSLLHRLPYRPRASRIVSHSTWPRSASNAAFRFPKRDFRCDCPTSALQHPCTLHTTPEEENATNHYGQNFKGVFCRCGRPYDPNTERETMIQCLACEVRLETSSYFKFGSAPDRIGSTSRAVISENGLTQKSPCQHTRRNLRQIRGHKTTISMTVHLTRRLPIFHRPSYAPPTTTASFVHRVSGKYLPSFGTLGPMAVLSLSEMMSLHHGELSNQLKMRLRMSMFLSGSKRALSPSAEEPEAKRTRTEASNPKSPCLAPPINPVAQRILIASDPGLGTGDVFLTEDFRGRLCRCASVLVHQLYSDVAADSNRVASSAFLPSKPTSSFSKRRRHMSRLMILIQVVYIP